MSSGEARHHAQLAPRRTERKGVLMGFDRETEQPYYFDAKDATRELARRYGVLDTSACAPEWGLENRPQQHEHAPSISFQPKRKPKRSEYPRGARDNRRFA